MCKICSKPTINPEGICGFCMLHNTLADYTSKDKSFVENMPTDRVTTKEYIQTER